MDSDAENYEQQAKQECNCCYYYGKGHVTYEYDYYEAYIYGRVSSLIFYVNGEKVGQTQSELISFVPDPDQQFYGIKTPQEDDKIIVFDLGNQRKKSFLIKVTDQNKNLMFLDTVLITANKFTAITL